MTRKPVRNSSKRIATDRFANSPATSRPIIDRKLINMAATATTANTTTPRAAAVLRRPTMDPRMTNPTRAAAITDRDPVRYSAAITGTPRTTHISRFPADATVMPSPASQHSAKYDPRQCSPVSAARFAARRRSPARQGWPLGCAAGFPPAERCSLLRGRCRPRQHPKRSIEERRVRSAECRSRPRTARDLRERRQSKPAPKSRRVWTK